MLHPFLLKSVVKLVIHKQITLRLELERHKYNRIKINREKLLAFSQLVHIVIAHRIICEMGILFKEHVDVVVSIRLCKGQFQL